jgi:hypothetical protein
MGVQTATDTLGDTGLPESGDPDVQGLFKLQQNLPGDPSDWLLESLVPGKYSLRTDELKDFSSVLSKFTAAAEGYLKAASQNDEIITDRGKIINSARTILEDIFADLSPIFDAFDVRINQPDHKDNK